MTAEDQHSLMYLRPEVQRLKETLDEFVEKECIPAEKEYESHMASRHGTDRWTLDAVPPCVGRLKKRAKELGLWNMFLPPRLISHLPDSKLGPSVPLTYREYGIMCESLGRSISVAPEACNTSAPDTGNMEVLLEFGTPTQQAEFLVPLLRGEIRSAFLMTEPDVASSDPTNLSTKLTKKVAKDQNGKPHVHYVLTGRKWWSTGAMDPRCRVALVVAKMDYSDPSLKEFSKDSDMETADSSSLHGAHTIVIVPMPHPQIKVERALSVFGYDDAPHGHAEVSLNGLTLTTDNLILGEGSGFRVSQARLGPGRIHHCMRSIGIAARCLELMMQRAMERKTFGKYLWEHGGCQEMIADSVADLTAARLLTLSCASAMDSVGPRQARGQIGMIKYAVPEMTLRVVDRTMQILGGAGVSQDFVVAYAFAGLRTLRIADGPDAVHKRTVALRSLKKVWQKQQSRL